MNRFFYNKVAILVLIILSLFSFLSIWAFDLQISSKNSYKNAVINNLVKTEYKLPARGRFVDANGVVLADNIEYFEIYLSSFFSGQNEKTELIRKIQSYSQDEFFIKIVDRLNQVEESDQNILLIRDLDSSTVEKYSGFFKEFEELILKNKFKRSYKFGEQFSHIIGYTGQPSEQDLLDDFYSPDDLIGKYRLEKILEKDLRGIKEKKVYQNGIEQIQAGVEGSDIFLTIDSKWQNSLYSILRNHRDKNGAENASGVIIEADSGKVRAMVGFPSFNSNDFIEGISDEEYKNLLDSYGSPLLDKPISTVAQPGSTFKLITSYSLLENNIIDENSTYFSNRCVNLGGGINFCEYGKLFYGQMNLNRALYMSSNLFFCNYTLELEQKVGIDRLVEAGKGFGLESKSGIILEGEAIGNMDEPADKINNEWYSGNSCNASIGQGGIQVSPLQMAQVVSLIKNEGRYIRPVLIDKGSDLESKNNTESEIKNLNINSKTRELILEGMHNVIRSPESVLYWIFSDIPNEVKAKTGTAEAIKIEDGVAVDKIHGWIVGYFNYRGKDYIFSFHLHFGGGGYYTSFVLKDFLSCLNSNFEKDICK